MKPGLTPDDLPEPLVSQSTESERPTRIRGKALIFWDPKNPSSKRDAIDTDQITPAADCVSESLETLDERWKAGSFRYLMPDFRERVHRGETFLIAGDRFAIGSSREMSPAGLKGVAEEAALEMVIVCGNAMGDIFRRNALNLGLHVVQSPEAVADARDGDVFSFDPETRALANETQGKSYEPVPLTPKEDEIRRTGGIFAVGRRELRRSTERQTGGGAIFPRQAAIANDYFVFTGKAADDRQTASGGSSRASTASNGLTTQPRATGSQAAAAK